jgi:endoglucanase
MYLAKFFFLTSILALAVAAPSQKEKRVKNFKWFGVNESGAEFGAGNLPGTLGKDYTWPVR